MDGMTLKEKYGHMFAELDKLSKTSNIIDETNVMQEANPALRKIAWGMMAEYLLPGSRIEGRENFAELYSLLQAGKHCLILPEHYGMMDLPSFCWLLDADGSDFGREIAEKVVAIATMKLQEEVPALKAWAEAFPRINVYPSRSIASLQEQDTEIFAREMARSKSINMASMRALNIVRNSGRPVLMFPWGTRYRPGRPDTKRSLRETDTYVRFFDYMVLVSINGCCLRINPANTEDMLADTLHYDKVIVSAGPVINCKEFRANIINALKDKPEADIKQALADKITELLEVQHVHYEKIRQAEI
jgi:glycerol-3-phosphate O-acyltransferase